MKTLNHTEMKDVNGGVLGATVIAALIGGGAALVGTIATIDDWFIKLL